MIKFVYVVVYLIEVHTDFKSCIDQKRHDEFHVFIYDKFCIFWCTIMTIKLSSTYLVGILSSYIKLTTDDLMILCSLIISKYDVMYTIIIKIITAGGNANVALNWVLLCKTLKLDVIIYNSGLIEASLLCLLQLLLDASFVRITWHAQGKQTQKSMVIYRCEVWVGCYSGNKSGLTFVSVFRLWIIQSQSVGHKKHASRCCTVGNLNAVTQKVMAVTTLR